MEKTVTLKKIIYLLLYLLFGISMFFSYDTLYKIIIVSTINLFIGCIGLKVFGYKLCSFPMIFCILTFLFHLGQVYVVVFNISIDLPFDPIHRLNSIDLYNSLKFIVRVHYMLYLGVMLARLLSLDKKDTNELIKNLEVADPIKKNNQIGKARTMGHIIIMLSVFPKLYINISKYILYFQGGYLDTYLVQVNGYINILASIFVVGVALIIIANKDNKRKAIIIYFLYALYSIMFMITGNRIVPLIEIITLTIVLTKFVIKVRFKTGILFLISSYILLIFINGISEYRMSGDFSWEVFKLENNPIIDAMAEFGCTLISVGYAFETFPNQVDFNFGMTYIHGFLTIFPNFGYMDTLRGSLCYVYEFANSSALGGSYIGELYYNFGQFGILFAGVFGLIIGVLYNKMEKYANNMNYVNYAIALLGVPTIISLVRGYVIDLYRIYFVFGIFIKIIDLLYVKHLEFHYVLPKYRNNYRGYYNS